MRRKNRQAITQMQKKKSNMKSLSLIFLGLGFLVNLISCDSNKVYEENIAVSDDGWMNDDIKTFSFDVVDTLSPINIFVNLRTTIDYQYSNIYVFLYSEFPNGTTDKDTLEFLLAELDGKWLGENTGTVVEFKGLIASGGRFSTEGKYTFQLQHAMREELLPEIIDVGMRIETKEE